MAACTACGTESLNLIEIFPGENIGRKLPFCTECISMGAFELPFVADRNLEPQQVLQRVVRVNRAALNEVRAARADVTELRARLDALEQAMGLRAENEAASPQR